jgi:hypothetical protein
MRATLFLMPRAENSRGKVRGALPRIPARGTPPETPGPLSLRPMFQNGPRRQGFASPRKNRAPLTAYSRSTNEIMDIKRGGLGRPPVGSVKHQGFSPFKTFGSTVV